MAMLLPDWGPQLKLDLLNVDSNKRMRVPVSDYAASDPRSDSVQCVGAGALRDVRYWHSVGWY
eukprot:1987640-Rhodomonas_salina.1